jgi:O-antigen/teichoic acid export membrane protein
MNAQAIRASADLDAPPFPGGAWGALLSSPAMAHLAPREIARDFIYVSSARLFALAVSFVRSLFIPRILGPTSYGMWKSLGIIQSYMQFADLGAAAALKREIPLYESRGDVANAARARDVAFFVNNLAVLIASVGAMTGSFLLDDTIYATALRLFILILFARQANSFLEKLLFWRKDFSYASRLSLVLSIVETALAITGTLLFGLNGLIVGTFAGYAFVVLLQLRRIRFEIGFAFRWSEWIDLVKIGFPSHVNGLLYNIFTSIDRLLILPVLGLEGLGLYGLAMTINEYLFQLSYAFGNVLSPRLVEKYGEKGSIEDLRPLVEKPTLAIAVGAPVLLGSVFFTVGPAIRIVLPEFVGAILPLKVLLVGTYFSSLHRGLSSFFLAIRRQARLLPAYGSAILANGAFVWLALQLGAGITGVAIVSSTVMAGFSIALIVMARWFFVKGIADHLKFIGTLALPLLWGAASTLAAERAATSGPLEGAPPAISGAVGLVTFLILYLPALYSGYRMLRRPPA